MSEWFQAKVKFLRQLDNGLIKEIKEVYLADSVSFADCEARIFQQVGEGMREVTMMTIAKSPIKDVVFYGDTDLWWKVQVKYELQEEESGKVKKITTYLLVNANDLKESYERTEEHLKEMLVPFRITKSEESPIVDVFEYNKEARPRHVQDKAQDLKSEAGRPKIGFHATIDKLRQGGATIEIERKTDALIESKVGKARELSAKMIERRDEVKQLFGENYAQKVAEWTPILQACMDKNGLDSPFGAVLIMSKEDHVDAVTGSLIVAVAVEMSERKPIDPTQGQAHGFEMGKKSYMEDGGMSDDGDEEDCEMEGEAVDENLSEALYASLTSIQRRRLLQIHTDHHGSGPQQIQAEFGWTIEDCHAMMDYLDGLAAIDETFLDDEEDGETDLEGRLDAAFARADKKN